MAVDYSKFNFSQPSTDTAQSGATTPEVAQQQATSPLPSLEPKYVNLKPEDFQSPDQFAIAQRELEKQADKDYEQRVAEFIPLANQRYGINPELGKNNLNYRQLNAQLDKDGVTSTQRYEIQQQWIKSAEKFRDSLPDGDRKTQLTQQIEQIKEIPMTVQEGSIPNRIAESWRQNSPAMEAQAERFANAATHRITMTDTDILKKYDPELLEEVEKAGGIAYIRNIGAGSNIDPNEDVLGVGGMLKFGTTEKERELGKRMLEKLENYRAKETLSRTDLNGEEVTLPDGRKVKMSNQQAAEYYANQGSSIKGRNEWLKYFEEHPFSSLKSVDGILNFFQSGLDSSIRQAPLMVAGTAAMFFNPTAGLAIMNSGNISDQELAAVNKAATDEYKKLHGKDADITKLPAQEYLNFLQDLADKGIISKASNEGIRTGTFMSTAETLTGGFVNKLGVAALKKMTATELSSKLKTQAAKWALGTAGYGLKISDEGLQELSSTIIENVRAGKKWNDGLTQAFLLGTFSIENASQHLGRGVNKLREKAKAEKAENDADKASAQPTENAQPNQEQANAEPTQGQAQPTNTEQAQPTDTTQASGANTATQNTPTDVNALLAEWERLGRDVNEDGEVSNENALRLDEIEKQIANDTGRSFQSVYGEWKNNGSVTTQGNVNENRTDNRTGSENADGQTDGQGTNEPNASGTQRSDETSEPVSQTQTETPTAGDSQSDTQPTADSTQQQNNNSPESDTTGSDGRTTETNSTRGEQGELGQNGSGQSGEPTQATSEGSTDSGVRERTQSNSVGETLVNRKTVARSYNNDVESERNPYNNITEEKGIDEAIAKSRESVAKFREQGDNDNAKWELDYLRQAYARKERISGKPQLDNFRSEIDRLDPIVGSPVSATVYRGGSVQDRELMWFSSNQDVARTYEKDGNVSAARVEMKSPRIIDAEGAVFSQVKSTTLYPPRMVRERLPDVYNQVIQAMYGRNAEKIAGGNLMKKSDRIVFDTLVHNALVDRGELSGPKYDGVVIKNVIDPGNKNTSVFKGKEKEDLLGDNFIPFSKEQISLDQGLSSKNATTESKQDSGRAEQPTEAQSPVSDEGTTPSETSDNSTRAKPTKPKRTVKSKRKDSDSAEHVEESGSKNTENVSGDDKDKAFLSADKNTFATKQEMVDAMRDAMSSHLDDKNANAALFDHANNLADQRKGRKGWSAKVKVTPPNNALIDLTPMIANAERKHREATDKRSAKGESEVTPSERLQYPKDMTDEDIVVHKEKMAKHRETLKSASKERAVPAIEKENRINRAIDNAVEQSRPENDPVRQIRETKSVKINGKSYDGNIAKLVKARELMDNGLPFEEAWKAFIEAGGSPQSRSVLERGGWKVTAKKQQRNQIVSEAVEQRGAKAGDIVRFDGAVISKNSVIADISPAVMFEIEDHPIQSQMVEIANHLETDARETADVAIDRTEQETGTSVEAVKDELFKQEPSFFVDENLAPLTKAQDITNEQVVAAANDKSILDKVSDKVKQFLNTLNKAIMSVLAVVAVGSMTIPTDAHAQTGYSVYESGPKVAGVSQKASDTINWVLKNKDHNGKSFVVADKEQGKIHIIGTDGKVLDTQNAIFGKNKGDTVGVGNTPSGRFLLTKMSTDTLSDSDKRLFGDSVLDLRDKETGQKVRNEKGQVVAIHRVLNTPVRKQALISATPNDNFLSQGCINVPTAFYNQAVNDLDGSMVYVLAQEKGSNMSNGTAKSSNVKNAEVKSSNTTRGTTKTTPSRSNMSGVPAASGLGVPAASGLRFSVRPKDIAKVNDRITEKSLMKSLDRTLGKLADKVNFITSDQMQNTKGLEYFTKNGVEGFYDPRTQQVFIVADNIAPAHGLTAEERLAFVAWHEMTHLGLDTKYGKELHRILDLAGDNLFVSDLALAIQRERASRGERTSVSDSMAIEEALAELNAALNTGNVKTLEDRYGVRVPKEFRNDIKHDTDTFFDKVRKLVRKLLGKPNISNAQIREILAGLDENIAKYAAPESREVTARLNEILNDPTSVLGETPRFSVRSTIGSTVRWVDNFIHRLLSPKRPLESPGAEPSAFMGQDIPYQEQTDALNWREKKSEEWADSDMPAIKYMGGAGTKIVQLLKSTKNRVAKNHRKWVRQIEFLNARMKARAKKMAKKGIYKKDQTYRIDTDIQRLNTSLAAITNVFKNGKLEFAAMNKQLIEDYKKRINGYDETDANGNTYRVEGLIEKMTAFGYDFANNTMPDYTPYQRKQLMRLKNEYEKMTRALAKMEASDNLILSTKGLKGLANKQNLTAQQMQDLADAKTLRKDLRMHNGLTTAEAYDTITDLVKTGKIDITYDGKSWLDYIADVGFTPEQGFVDISKDYSIDFDKLQVNGELAALAKDARTLAQEMYQFQEQELGKELSGVSHGHPFFTPTMGESKNLKLWINFDDKNNTIEIPGTQTIDDKISDEEAAEWQSQRLGRAFMGAGTTQNLNLLAEQVSRRAGWKAIGEQMLQDGKDNKYKVRVVPTNDPGFADAKGIVVSEKLKNGATRYVKVALDDTRANDALFGDNVATVGHLASAKWLGFINRSVATFITATPAFSVWNAYRGLREKHQQIQSWSNKLPQGSAERYFFDSLDKKHQDMLMGFGGLNFSRALAWRTIVNLFKGFTTKGYLRASLVMAQEMGTTRDGGGNWFTKGVRSVLLAGNGAKETYAKLKAVYDAGGITTRSDSNSYSAKELAEIYGKGGVGSKAIKGLEHFQERMLTLTTAFELVSTLSTLDTLESMGMPQEKAIQANLHFMNFNDRGASATSAWIRASVPFANATAQGARSTARSFKTWNGIKAGIRRTAWTVAGLIVSNMLREMFPCEEDLGEASFRDRNDAELMRELPIRIGCDFEIRLPIAYGADMIWHAIGVAGYQHAMGNWNTKQALGAIWHSVLENSSPVPQTPASANSWVENLFAPFIPRPVMVAINLARDKDDFGNKLSARGADEKSQKYKFAKKNTSPFWSGFAEALHTIGIKMTPEQARYAINGWVSPWGVDMVDGFTKPLKEGETRIGRIANAMVGGKTAIRQVRNEGQSSFIKVKNNLSRYASLDEEITNGVENKELKFGSTNANTKSWLKKRIEDGTFKKEDEETVRVILDWRKAQAQINSKQVSPERKEKLYTEANKKYLKAMHAIEDRD